MRQLIVILAMFIAFAGCVKKNKVPTAQSVANPAMHEVKVNEVIQTSKYTYLKVTENNAEYWMAVNRQEASAGETYYYETSLEMKNFKSKELDRTFETIYFVQGISTQPLADVPQAMMTGTHNGKVSGSLKEGIAVAPAEGSISIAQLYTDSEKLAGKKIKMSGQVVKVNNEVMDKNWVHIQDGTKSGESFDLTITTLDQVKVDDIVTFEGTISVKKDFGYGYFYELIMEDAKLIKQGK